MNVASRGAGTVECYADHSQVAERSSPQENLLASLTGVKGAECTGERQPDRVYVDASLTSA